MMKNLKPRALRSQMLSLAAASLIAGLWVAALPAASTPRTAPISTKRKVMPRAVWVWDSLEIARAVKDARARREFFAFARSQRLSTLFLHPNDLLDPRPMPQAKPEHVTAAQMRAFLRQAHANKLEVHALQGAPEYVLQAEREPALDRLRKLLAFNRGSKAVERFDGMHWDIEPYLLPRFREGEEGRRELSLGLLQFAQSARRLAQEARGPSSALRMGFAMPFWMDEEAQSVSWRGQLKPTTMHLIDLLGPAPGGYLALMSYRDTAAATIEVAAQEVAYARQHAPGVPIWVGQELNDVRGDPPSITYFDEGPQAFARSLLQLEAAYKEEPSVAGVAIHDWKAFKALLASRTPR